MRVDEGRLDRLASTIGDAAFRKFIDATLADIEAVRTRIAASGEISPGELRASTHKLVGLFSQAGFGDAAEDLRSAVSNGPPDVGPHPRLVRMCDDVVGALKAFVAARSHTMRSVLGE